MNRSKERRASKDYKPSMVFVGNFPPPITGQTYLNQKLAEILTHEGINVQLLDIRPDRSQRDTLYQMAKVFRLLVLPFQLLSARVGGTTSLMYALNGGHSTTIDAICVGMARVFGFKTLLYHHSSQFAKKRSRLMRMVMILAGKRAQQIMASQSMSRDIVATYGIANNLTIVDNSAYVDVPMPDTANEAGRFRLGLLSNLTKTKGLDTSIQTLEALTRLGCDCELVLAGPAIDREAEKSIEAARQKHQDKIKVLGRVNGESKDNFFRSIDVFLFPSTYEHETQSLVVPEAQSYGCPVIVYDHGYVAENIPDSMSQCVIPADRSFADHAALLVRDWINNPNLFSDAQEMTCDHFLRRHRKASNAVLNLAHSLKGNIPTQAL